MEIVLARSSGYCMGVRRAVELALEVAGQEPGPVYTNGPLIHNPQALEQLQAEGIVPLDSEAEIPPSAVIIRAHGVPPDVRRRIEAHAAHVVDATCPKVATIQKRIAEHSGRGYTVIIAGDADHPEVVGLLGHAEGPAFVVSSAAEVASLPPAARLLLVAQTTQDEEVFAEIRAAVLARYPHAKALATICQSTHRRQAEVRDMAGTVDAIVVIGGRNSANTCRLAEISRNLGTAAYHVETAAELPIEELRQLRRVGVTAGASTPEEIIVQVVAALREAAAG